MQRNYFSEMIVAFFIGSLYDINILKIIFSIYIILLYIFSTRVSLHRDILLFLMILVVGVTNSLLYSLQMNLDDVEFMNILLRDRYFFIQTIFAIAIYLYLDKQTLESILRIITFALFFNIIVGMSQLLFYFEKGRLLLMFPEPSAAGFFYIFIFLIAYYKLNVNKVQFVISRIFLVLGLLIGSKGQYLVLFIYLFIHIKWIYKTILVILIILFSTVLIENFERLSSVLHLLDMLNTHGIAGLNSKYQVWTSFSLRLSSIYVAIMTLIDHPLGIGFGGYNNYYVYYLKESGLIDLIAGREISGAIWGEVYQTPRSALLEIIVSTGVFGVYFFWYLYKKFSEYKKEYRYLYLTYIYMLLAAFLLELNPFMMYISVILIMLKKEKGISNG